jgi:hypothetical protein
MHELCNIELDFGKLTNVWIVFESTTVPFRM